MADFTAGQTQGNESEAANVAKASGIGNPSQGLIRYLAYGDTAYSPSEATQYGLPLTSGMLQQQRMEAIAPAVRSLEASKPETTQAFDTRTSQLSAEKQPLIDRYSNIIDQLKGREARETATTATNTATEYGKRGIPLSSGAYQEVLANKTADVGRFYGGQIKEAGLAQEADLRDLNNQINNLTISRTQALRDIDNRIAEMQAGAGNQAASDALQMYREQIDRKFQSRFDDLDRKIKEKSLQPAAPDTEVITAGGRKLLINKQNGSIIANLGSSSEGGSSGLDLTGLLKQLGLLNLGGEGNKNDLSTFEEDKPTSDQRGGYSSPGGIGLG